MTTILMSYGNCGGSQWTPPSSFAAGVVEGAPVARRLEKSPIQEGYHEHLRFAGDRTQGLH